MSKLRLYRDTIGLIDRTVRSVATLIGNARNPLSKHGALPLTAPRTPCNHSISPHRSVAFARFPLDEVKAVKDALGVKVNDIVLAVCAGTLRQYLEGLDALPEEPLVAVCPVSVRDDDERGTQGNKVSAMFTSLATDIDDPGERLRAIAPAPRGPRTTTTRSGPAP